MKTRYMIPTFLTAAALTAGAYAGGDAKAPEFSKADMDGNGELSTQEARQALPDEVVIVDTNNDGTLNRDEVQSAMPNVSFNDQGSQDGAIGESEWQTIRDSLEMDSTQGGQSEASQPLNRDSLDGESQSEASAGDDLG